MLEVDVYGLPSLTSVGESALRNAATVRRIGPRFAAVQLPAATRRPAAVPSKIGTSVCNIDHDQLPEVNLRSPTPCRNLETRRERSLQLALAAARTADDNRGQDVVVLDMRRMTPEFDYFVLATGNSRRQLHAISEEIDRVLEGELGDQRLGIEGYNESRWILLDYGSVVIHLFDAETRTLLRARRLVGHGPAGAAAVAEAVERKEIGRQGRRDVATETYLRLPLSAICLVIQAICR